MSAMASKASLPWRMSSWAALLTVLSGTWTGLALGTMHQEGPNNSLKTCCIPASLGSFQGKPVLHLTTSSVELICDAFAYDQSDRVLHQPDSLLLCFGPTIQRPILQILKPAMDCAGTYHCNSSVIIFQSGSVEEIVGILQEFKVVKEEGTSYRSAKLFTDACYGACVDRLQQPSQ